MNNLGHELKADVDQLPHLAQKLNNCLGWRYEDLNQMLAAYLEVLKKSDLADYARDESSQ